MSMEPKVRAMIITGGNIDIDFALDFLSKEKYDKIIAVDRGLDAVDAMLSRKPGCIHLDHLVGDFDSVDKSVLEKYKDYGDVTVHTFNPVKDNTDTDIAIKLILQLCQEGDIIYILGGTGTRLDHTMANIHILRGALEAGVEAYLVDPTNKIYLHRGIRRVAKSEQYGQFISILPVGDEISGVFLRGFKYPLNNAHIRWGSSLGISNEIVEDEGVIEIGEGTAIVFEVRE